MTNHLPLSDSAGDQPLNPVGSPHELSEVPFSEYEKIRRGEAPAPVVTKTEAVAKQSAPASAKPAGQKDSSTDSDPEETEGKEGKKDDSDAEDESKDELEAKEGEEERPKKKGGFQRRIDKLNARYSAAQAEIEHWKTVALKSGADDSRKPEPKADLSKSVQPDGKPVADNFESHAEYVEALTDWKLEQRLKARDAEEQRRSLEAEQQRAQREHFERVQTFAKQHDDFEEALSDVDDIPVSAAFQELIVTSDQGPALMYELAKNRKEYERIAQLSPLACARELGKIETRIAARASEASAKKPEPKTTKAPKPIEPVGGSKGTVQKSLDDPDLSFAEYERMRREQMKRRRG